MSTQPNKAPVISLSEGFGAVVVQGPNIKVELFDDGRIVAYTDRDIEKRHPASARTLSDAASPDALAIGAEMPDGSIYAGVSPDTGRPMYTTPKDSGLCGEWRRAMDYAAGLDAHGHKDWRAPTTAELKVLCTHCAAIGNFDETGSNPGGWYWSSTQTNRYDAWAQRFSGGNQFLNLCKDDAASLRCVRG
jgi:hypothetical protein